MFKGIIGILAGACALAQPVHAQAPEPVVIRAAVLRVDDPGLPPISRLELPPEDLGFAGADLATDDNDTTGRFMGQDFQTVTVSATTGNRRRQHAPAAGPGHPLHRGHGR